EQFISDKLLTPQQPYSHGIITSGRQLWLSGVLPIDPATGQLVERDFEKQATQVFENLKAAVESSGVTLAHAIKVNVYLYDTKDHYTMNDIYARYFTAPYPARTTIQSLLRVSLIEVDAVIALDGV
ncbi:MAG: Rid family hydrolase, partial [Trueperaceae bacterium]